MRRLCKFLLSYKTALFLLNPVNFLLICDGSICLEIYVWSLQLGSGLVSKDEDLGMIGEKSVNILQ